MGISEFVERASSIGQSERPLDLGSTLRQVCIFGVARPVSTILSRVVVSCTRPGGIVDQIAGKCHHHHQ